MVNEEEYIDLIRPIASKLATERDGKMTVDYELCSEIIKVVEEQAKKEYLFRNKKLHQKLQQEIENIKEFEGDMPHPISRYVVWEFLETLKNNLEKLKQEVKE